MPEPKDVSYSPAAFIQRGSFSDDSETIPIDDVDELEELAEVDNEEAKEWEIVKAGYFLPPLS